MGSRSKTHVVKQSEGEWVLFAVQLTMGRLTCMAGEKWTVEEVVPASRTKAELTLLS